MSQQLPFYRRPITLKTVLLVIFVPVLAVAIPALLWLVWAVRPLNVASEFGVTMLHQVPPSPNGADLADTIYRKFATGRNVTDMATLQQAPPAPGAATQKFIEKYNNSNRPVARILDPKAPASEENDDKLYPLAGKLKWIEQNKEAFALLDSATAAPYYTPPVRSEEDDKKMFDRLGNARQLARYNWVRCDAYAAQGKYALAVDKALNMWEYGLKMQHNATLVGTLGGFAVEAISRQPVDDNIAHLNSSEAAQAAKRMERMQTWRPSFYDMLIEERASFLATIVPRIVEQTREEARSLQRETAYERGEYNFEPEDKPDFRLLAPVINWSARKMAYEYLNATQHLLSTADRPWSQRHFQLPAETPPQHRDLINVIAKGRFNFVRSDVALQIFKTRLALHAYRKANGVYPASLNQLVPAYLSKIPTDGFADGKPMLYRREGQRYKLWSVGPDGRNDNARPIVTPDARPKARFLVSPDSQGDFVASVNR